jgi:hypothetical protein
LEIFQRTGNIDWFLGKGVNQDLLCLRAGLGHILDVTQGDFFELGRERFPNPKLSGLLLIVILCHINRNDKLVFYETIFPRRFVDVNCFVGFHTDEKIEMVNLSAIAFALFRLWLSLLWDMSSYIPAAISSHQPRGSSCFHALITSALYPFRTDKIMGWLVFCRNRSESPKNRLHGSEIAKSVTRAPPFTRGIVFA